MRELNLSAIVLGLALLFGTPACKQECSFNGDCPSPTKCVDNRCQQPVNTGGRPDATGPAPDADAGAPGPDVDAESPADVDSGARQDAADIGPRDVPNVDVGTFSACGDGGMTTIPDAAMAPSSGLVVYGEYTGSMMTTVVRAFAEFYDRSGTTQNVINQRFADDAGGGCTLTLTRQLVGAPQGLTAQSIQLTSRGGGTPAQMRQFDPVSGMVGRFEPSTALMPRFLAGQTDVYVAVRRQANPMPNTLDNAQADPVQIPDFFIGGSANPPAGTPLSVQSLLQTAPFSWMPTPGSAGLPRIELYDARREDVLLCIPARDTGRYLIPGEALRAWNGACPLLPATLEIRYESDSRWPVPVINGTLTRVPMDTKIMLGVQYPVTR